MPESAVLVRAREALRLADAEPRRAVALAAAAAAEARRLGDGVAAAVADRASGLAVRQHGDLDSAIAHLERAVRTGTACGATDVTGEARMTLAFVLIERGRPRRALREIDQALRELEGVAHARALTQRGTMLMELGRYGEAIDSYRAALPLLRDRNDVLGIYRVVANRGLAHAYRHEFAAAEADLREAERLADELMLPLSVGFARANLAWLLGLRGEVPAALEYSFRAEERIRAHGAQVGELLKDRSELLLSVRLITEAKEAAQQSIAEYETEQRGIKLPQVRLALAQAEVEEGDPDAGLAHARLAAREFARQGRPEWAARARVTALRAERLAGRRSATAARGAEEAAAALTAARWPAAAVEAHLLAADLLRGRAHGERAADHLREAARSRRSGPALLRARAWYAEALLRNGEGRRRAAYAAVLHGLQVLDDARAVLAATDLRAYAAGHRTELTCLGLRMAVQDGRPRDVLAWAERSRATDLLVRRPPRPPDEPQIAQALAELRETALRITELRTTGTAPAETTRLAQRQAALERQVRDDLRRRRAPAIEPTTPPSPERLASALRDAALVEFVELNGTLLAVTLVGGRTRLHSLGPVAAADSLVDRIAFALRTLLRRDAPAAGRAAARGLLEHAAGRTDELLMGRLPELGDRPLVVVPTGSLQSLPWAVLPTCAARPVTVSPSAALWYAARTRPADGAGAVVVAAGPTLPGAEQEARAVGAVHGVDPLLPPEATVAEVLARMEGAGLVHLAAHGRLATHNPLFSDVLLADGPLLAYDVERLRRPPHTVVLAACESGRSVVCAGDELLGLSATFLAAGTSQLVAAVLQIPDMDAAPVMVELHRLLAAGVPAAEALAATRERMRGADETLAAAAACFLSLGAGFGPLTH